MANTKIYFYPADSGYGGLEVLDFGERLSDLQITPYRIVNDAVSMGGRHNRVARRQGLKIRIILERFTDYRLAEQFYSLQSHLEAGGGFSLAVDDDKKFAAFVNSVASTGGDSRHNVFRFADRLLSEYGSDGLAQDDVVHLESFGVSGRREELLVSSYTASTKEIQTTKGAIYRHILPSFIRHRDFFPFLIWPEENMGNPILTHDHRISWTVDFSCEVYPGNIQAAFGTTGTSGNNLSTTTDGGQQEASTLDDVFDGSVKVPDWMLEGSTDGKVDDTYDSTSAFDGSVESVDTTVDKIY